MRNTRSLATLLGVALVFGAVPALAQDDEDQNLTQEVLRTQFIEAVVEARGAKSPALKGKKFEEAKEVYRELRKNHGKVVTENLGLQFLFAQVQFETDDLEASKNSLTAILEKKQDHVEALYLLAKILAKQAGKGQDGDPQARARARDYLIQSARFGQFVLRDLDSKEGKQYFGFLKDSEDYPKFILAVMQAPNDLIVNTNDLHNPFKSPLKLATEEVVDDSDGRGDLIEELQQEIEELFQEIEALARNREHEELVVKFTELRQLMSRYGESGAEQVRGKLEEWQNKLRDLGEIWLSIKLQVYINEGNNYLRSMQEAIEDEQYDRAIETFSRIEEVVEDMRNEDREVFHRNADAVFHRGRLLYEKALRYKRISEFVLVVTGVVTTPEDDDQENKAIINDRIYEENDAVIDEETQLEIEGLKVARIGLSRVTFRYEDTEFVRELQAP